MAYKDHYQKQRDFSYDGGIKNLIIENPSDETLIKEAEAECNL
jgi:hypothetical protein